MLLRDDARHISRPGHMMMMCFFCPSQALQHRTGDTYAKIQGKGKKKKKKEASSFTNEIDHEVTLVMAASTSRPPILKISA